MAKWLEYPSILSEVNWLISIVAFSWMTEDSDLDLDLGIHFLGSGEWLEYVDILLWWDKINLRLTWKSIQLNQISNPILRYATRGEWVYPNDPYLHRHIILTLEGIYSLSRLVEGWNWPYLRIGYTTKIYHIHGYHITVFGMLGEVSR